MKEQLALLIDGARQRGEPVDHLLFSGPPGLGKTTLGQIVANEMGAGFQPTSGPALDRPSDLAAILTNLEDGDVLFVDEIHRMPRTVEEVLYPALEDFNLDVVLGKGPTARSIRLELPRFTLVGRDDASRAHHAAAARAVRVLAAPGLLLGRGSGADRAALRGHPRRVETDADGADEIARRSRGTPRIANRLLRRVRDFAEVRHDGRHHRRAGAGGPGAVRGGRARVWTGSTTRSCGAVVEKFGGGPVGLSTLAAAVGEEPDTVEDVVEPYLMQLGFLQADPARPGGDRAGVPPPGRHRARHLAHLAAALHRFCRSGG